MELFIISVSSPKDRDLILGLVAGAIKLTYTEATARGPNMKFGRKGMLQVGQLTKEGTRISFRTKGESSGMNDNPDYMKAWAEAANEMKKQGKGAVLDGFWPQLDSQDAIKRNSPIKQKKRHDKRMGSGDRSGRRRNLEDPNTRENRNRTREKIGYAARRG
jgi:hypothetical protein